MKLLKSKKFVLPTLYFITDREEIKDIPIGVPFMYGDAKSEKYIIQILEYEILYQEAKKLGYPFNFRKILEDNGYKSLKKFGYDHPAYLEYKTDVIEDIPFDWNIDEKTPIYEDRSLFDDYIQDSAVHVDIQKLKDLKVFPIWLDSLENAVSVNIHNFSLFNENMYNKQLDGMYGAMELKSPNKNLFIVDISGSIPKGASATVLAMSKNMAETCYADILITGTKSILYPYEELYKLNINTIYEECGMDNDQTYFKKLVTGDERHYKTAIVFGDNHSPCGSWNGSGKIDREDGKNLCKWKIDRLISFHTEGIEHIAGYADWFSVSSENIEKISNWVKYLD